MGCWVNNDMTTVIFFPFLSSNIIFVSPEFSITLGNCQGKDRDSKEKIPGDFN